MKLDFGMVLIWCNQGAMMGLTAKQRLVRNRCKMSSNTIRGRNTKYNGGWNVKYERGGPRLIWNTIPFHVRRTEIPCKDYCALDFWSCFPSFAEIQKYWKTEIPKNWNTPDAMIIASLVFRGVLLPSPISPFPLSSSIKLDKLIARLKTMMMIWQCWTNPRKIGPKISQNESDTPFSLFMRLQRLIECQPVVQILMPILHWLQILIPPSEFTRWNETSPLPTFLRFRENANYDFSPQNIRPGQGSHLSRIRWHKKRHEKA